MRYNLVVMESFGKQLRACRKDKNLTQKQLSEKSGVSESYISTLERDQPHSQTQAKLRPEPDKVEKLAKALNWNLDDARLAAGYAPTEEAENEKERLMKEVSSRITDNMLASGFNDIEDDDLRIAALMDIETLSRHSVERMLNEQNRRKRKP